jgi:hypothetical protein
MATRVVSIVMSCIVINSFMKGGKEFHGNVFLKPYYECL